MQLWWEVARRGFRRYATYRGATIGGLFTNTVFGFMRGYVLLALYRTRTDVGGFDATDAITYVWLTQGVIMVMHLWGWAEVANRVRTGEIATDLLRPLDYQAWWLAQDLGRVAYHVLARGVPPFVIGALAFHLRTPDDALVWLAFPASLALAVCVSFASRFLVNLAALWVLDARGALVGYGLAANFLSGFIIPVAFFPGWLETAARLLPFAAMIQVPIDVFLGKHTGVSLIGVLAGQAAWALALLAAGRAVLAAGTRRLVVQGG